MAEDVKMQDLPPRPPRGGGLAERLKRNPLSVALVTTLLRIRCRNVKSFVFVATTGRSGSKSLSRVFETVEGAVCFHEPYPIMFSNYLPGVDKTRYFRTMFKKVKLVNIMRSAIDRSYYIETNHQFIKNFADSAIEAFGSRIRVLHLVRNPEEAAVSFYRINSIPGVTEYGRTWLLDPRAEDNHIKLSDVLFGEANFNHDLYKCLWYCHETEARVEALRHRYPLIKMVSMRTEDLNSLDDLKTMFTGLEIPVDEGRLRQVVGMRENKKTELKSKTISIDRAIEMNQRLLGLIRGRYGDRFQLTGSPR